jgi:hypothetical protein
MKGLLFLLLSNSTELNPPSEVTITFSIVSQLTRLFTALMESDLQLVYIRNQVNPVHTLTLSHSQTLTLSRSHALTLSHHHTLTPSRSHTLALSHSHALTLSRPHTLTLAHSHTLTLSHSKTLIYILVLSSH